MPRPHNGNANTDLEAPDQGSLFGDALDVEASGVRAAPPRSPSGHPPPGEAPTKRGHRSSTATDTRLAQVAHPVRTPQRPPLAERVRPRALDELIGLDRLVGADSLLRRLVERREPLPLIFWGPPGSGKTTLARILVNEWSLPAFYLSAVTCGLPEVRAVFERSQETLAATGQPTVIFVDEIHRFNRAQQDAFLPYVEAGTIVLLGATTENPSFSVITPLLSRCRVLVLPPLAPEQTRSLLERTLQDAERGLGGVAVEVDADALDALVWGSDGDARRALNALEAAVRAVPRPEGAAGPARVTQAFALEALGGRYQRYERAGETYFNLLSALHKSLRGSDPDAAVYWLVRLIEAGEDPLVAARRMVAVAAEDVGTADPQALQIAVGALQAYQVMGSPEGDLALAEAAIYLACAPKSNASARALWAAREAVKQHGSLPVPMHLRNAITPLMREQGYGRGYRYPHDFPGAVIAETYLPRTLVGQRFYDPSDRGRESEISAALDRLRAVREVGSDPPPQH